MVICSSCKIFCHKCISVAKENCNLHTTCTVIHNPRITCLVMRRRGGMNRIVLWCSLQLAMLVLLMKWQYANEYTFSKLYFKSLIKKERPIIGILTQERPKLNFLLDKLLLCSQITGAWQQCQQRACSPFWFLILIAYTSSIC